MKVCAYLLVVFGLAASVHAELTLNKLFADNMVLQRGQKVSIWGSADPAAEITVIFAGQTQKTTAGDDGRWELKLTPMEKSFEPQTLAVASDKDGKTIKIRNVLVGDVWLCGGQSNMQRGFNEYSLLKDSVKNIDNPDIRSVIVAFRESTVPDDDVVFQKAFADAWHGAREPWLSPLSPTAYFFAEKIRKDLDVPVGLIVSAVGGTQIQRWLPKDTVMAMSLDSEASNGAGVLFNPMIYPLRNFTIKGVIWYQGESNGRIPDSYYALSQELINSWRNLWAENNPKLKKMPFYSVQLAPFDPSVDDLAPDAWAYIRDAQLKTLSLPNTGLAVITDLGEYHDIHPQDKKPVGERLALWAEKQAGLPVEESGPLFKRAVVKKRKILVYFTHVDSGLETRRVVMSSKPHVPADQDSNAYVVPADKLEGFTLCGSNGKFVPAEAVIVGGHVEVSSKEVPVPVAVRYGWSTFPMCNLFNKAGLPASPFRSDDFPVPDVQHRVHGQVWNGNESALGSKFEFTGSTPETEWASVERDGIKGVEPVAGQKNSTRYAYFKVTDPGLKSGKSPKVVLNIVYYGSDDGTLKVQYDSSDAMIKTVAGASGAWKTAAGIKMEKNGKWNVVEIPVEDALFDGRCNGADLRINSTDKAVLGGVYCSGR